MKKLLFIFFLIHSSLLVAGDLSLEWVEPTGKREIKVLNDSLRYSSMKHGVETLVLNSCSKKAIKDWEKKLAIISRKACTEDPKASRHLVVDNKVTVKRLGDCSGLTPSFSQVIGDILKCH